MHSTILAMLNVLSIINESPSLFIALLYAYTICLALNYKVLIFSALFENKNNNKR